MVEVVIEVEVVVVIEAEIGVEMEVGIWRGWDSEAVLLFCWDELVCRCDKFTVAGVGASLPD